MNKVIEPVEVVKETTPANGAEETISEVFNPQESVPLSKFLEIKNESKEAKRQIAELQAKIEDGATKVEISKGIKEIADEHNVDENFLSAFASTIKAQAEADLDNKISEKLKPFEEKGKTEKINEVFNKHFEKALEAMPEYKDIINKDVIKSLSLDPVNANKTFTKIIEDSYGHLIKGKRTIESSTPGKDDVQNLDSSKFKDPNYMKKVLADPELKKEYNKGLIERLNM